MTPFQQLNEAVVHQTHVATAFKQDAAVLSSDVEVKNMEIEGRLLFLSHSFHQFSPSFLSTL